MKNKKHVFIVLLIIITTFSALCANASVEITISNGIYKYAEINNGSPFMSLTGKEFSCEILYDNRPIKTREIIGFGILDYWSKDTGISFSNSNVRIDISMMYEFPQNEMSVFGGIGYRYLHSNIRGFTSTGNIGYLRNNIMIYMPLGIRTENMLSNGLTLNTEYDYMLKGTQYSALSDFSSLSNPSNNQPSGYGIRLSAKKRFYGFDIGVFYQYWNIKTSDPSPVYEITTGKLFGYAIEPANTTKIFGLNLSQTFF